MYEKILVLFLVLHYTRSALIELSCSDINTFISGQNAVRQLVAEGKVEGLPPAAEMNSVVWDEELAAKAEKWAASYPKSVDPDQTIRKKLNSYDHECKYIHPQKNRAPPLYFSYAQIEAIKDYTRGLDDSGGFQSLTR
ncbi:SCP-related protein precursor, partial [Danaus plexippus plexippus]